MLLVFTMKFPLRNYIAIIIAHGIISLLFLLYTRELYSESDSIAQKF